MKAIVWQGPNEMTVEEQPDPTDPGPGELILRPEKLTILTAASYGAIAGKVVSTVFQGDTVECSIDIGVPSLLRVIARADLELARDTPVWIGLDDTSSVAFRVE